MFLVDEQFRFEAPAALKHPGTDYYQVVESTMDQPVWVARVLDAGPSASFARYRTFFASDPEVALQILHLPDWSDRSVYAILPGHITGLAKLVAAKCRQVWRCEEPDGAGYCWRIEFDGVMLLISKCGTPLGEEVEPFLAWFDECK